MSNICKEWYKEYKKRYDENINLWNTDKEVCCKKITGHSLSQNAWRMIQISGAVDRMGGFANFSHYVNKCAETDYECFDEKVVEENEKLKAENEKLTKSMLDMLDDEKFPQNGYYVEMFISKIKRTLEELK